MLIFVNCGLNSRSRIFFILMSLTDYYTPSTKDRSVEECVCRRNFNSTLTRISRYLWRAAWMDKPLFYSRGRGTMCLLVGTFGARAGFRETLTSVFISDVNLDPFLCKSFRN